MKRLLVILFTTISFMAAASAATAATINIPVKVDKTIKNDGTVSDGSQLQYKWDENEHWESLFGFDLTGYIALSDIQSINSITFNAHATRTYYTGNNVHVYNSNNDDWATGTYTYGAYGASLGSNYFPAGAATPGGDPVDIWYAYDVTGVAGSLTDNGKLGLYLAMPTKDDWHNYAFHRLGEGTAAGLTTTAYLTINYESVPKGTISGTVYQSDGTTPITGTPITIFVATGDPCGTWSQVASGATDSNGMYEITGVPEGTCYLTTSNNNESYYLNEWWASPTSSLNCTGAQSIVVSAGGTITNKDFQLDYGGGITGKVISDIDGLPVAGVQIRGGPFPGGCCSWSNNSGLDGSYTLPALLPGYTRVWASGAGYLTEYYDNSYDPNWATAVNVTAGETTSGINFSMGKYGSISGTVTGSGGSPLQNVCVDVYRHQCANNLYASAETDSSGNYTISNLPPQAYYVKTRAACTSPQHYVNPWWKSSGPATFCDQAGAVTVTSQEETQGINFSLSPSDATYPGPSFRSAGVFSHHFADGSIGTTFYASINGPSPKDVSSFTATGPSGPFNLGMVSRPFRQLGNIYVATVSSVVKNGTYTFVVTDSLGRTATVTREFTYDSTVPQVDSSTMKVNGMGNQAYVGTATPTLTWDAVTWPDTPGYPGYYQVFVYDYDSRAVWWYQEQTDGTSITIPEGYLQPDTPYYWWVRACDIPTTGQKGQNRRWSETLYFYTGTKGLPDLSNPYNSIISYTTPDIGWANYFGANRINLAPWDIGLYSVTGPNGTVYNYNGRVYLLWYSMFYYCWSPGPAPTPDGTYTFELKDKDSNETTKTQVFTYNPASPIPEATRLPVDNAYIYTKSPTFSWAPPNGTGTFYYNLRIYDYYSMVHWYSASTGTETSVTLPDNLDWPPGSYKWDVRAYTDPEHTNAAYSSKRTITIPPISTYDYNLPGGTGVETDYRIFAIPLYTGTVKDLLKMMEKTLGAYNPEGRWRVFIWDAKDNNYLEIDTTSAQAKPGEPGRAAWIISRDTTTVPFEGSTAPEETYTLAIKSGWQNFGLPWKSTAIELGKIGVSDGTNTYLFMSEDNLLTQHLVWEYTGTGPYSGYKIVDQASQTLTPGTGYFIRVYGEKEVKLLIPPNNDGGHFPVSPPKLYRDNVFGSAELEMPPAPPGGTPGPTPIPSSDGGGGGGCFISTVALP